MLTLILTALKFYICLPCLLLLAYLLSDLRCPHKLCRFHRSSRFLLVNLYISTARSLTFLPTVLISDSMLWIILGLSGWVWLLLYRESPPLNHWWNNILHLRNLIPFENIEGPPKLLIDITRLHNKTTFYLCLVLLFFDFFYYLDASNILDTVYRLLFLGYKYRSFVSIVSDSLSSPDFGSEDKPFWLHCIWTSPGMMYALFSWCSVNLR